MKQIGLLILLCAIPGIMLGAALNGELDLNGSSGQNVAVGPCTGNSSVDCIDFDWKGTFNNLNPQTVLSGVVDGTGNGAVFDITNNFVGNNGGTSTTVTVGDLNSSSEPAGATVNDPGFITFNSDPWTVTLTEIQLGSDPAGTCIGDTLANGQTCTPAGTPFNEQNTCSGSAPYNPSNCTVDISFFFTGTATNGSQSSSVIGKFATTFSGTDYQLIDTDISQGLDVVTSDTGTINFTAGIATTPEPVTAALVGAGLIALGLLKRKRGKPTM
jgi:hypothetical protein